MSTKSTTERARVERLRRLLRRKRLMFVEVSAYVARDRVISTHAENADGATITNREYTALLREIVEAIR